MRPDHTQQFPSPKFLQRISYTWVRKDEKKKTTASHVLQCIHQGWKWDSAQKTRSTRNEQNNQPKRQKKLTAPTPPEKSSPKLPVDDYLYHVTTSPNVCIYYIHSAWGHIKPVVRAMESSRRGQLPEVPLRRNLPSSQPMLLLLFFFKISMTFFFHYKSDTNLRRYSTAG